MYSNQQQHLQYQYLMAAAQQPQQMQQPHLHSIYPQQPLPYPTSQDQVLAYLHHLHTTQAAPLTSPSHYAQISPSTSNSSAPHHVASPPSSSTPSISSTTSSQQYAPREMDNDEIVGKALKILHAALQEFASKMLKKFLGDNWAEIVRERLRSSQPMAFASTTFAHVAQEIADRKLEAAGGEVVGEKDKELDLRDLLLCVARMWDIFRNVLKPVVRSLCFELTGVRNNWAHQDMFTVEDTYRALDTTERVMLAIGAMEEAQVVRRDREGYAVYMAERLKQQGVAALTVSEQSSTSWCGPRGSARRDQVRSYAAPSSSSSSSSSSPSSSSSSSSQRSVQPSAARAKEEEFDMDWEL